jgi:hypothetical protein
MPGMSAPLHRIAAPAAILRLVLPCGSHRDVTLVDRNMIIFMRTISRLYRDA